MQEVTVATGMILKAEPIGEYDRRVVLLTMEYGKITAFARGARRPNSKLLASTSPFCYGHFKVYPGRNAYTLVDAEITHYFDELTLRQLFLECIFWKLQITMGEKTMMRWNC